MAVIDAARDACRAWYSGGAMGGAMSALADQLALIDKGQTHGAYSARGRSSGGVEPKGQAHEAASLRVGRSVQAYGEATKVGG